MTSEGPHHPGHEPTEGAPGTGTSAPYGDRPPMGRPTTTPDFGWAPPPAAQNPGDGDGNGWSPQENAARSTPGTRQGQPGAVRASASVPGAIFPPDAGSYAPPSQSFPPQQRQEQSFVDAAPYAGGSNPAGPPPWRGAEAQSAPTQPATPEVTPWSPQEAWGANGQSQPATAPEASHWQPAPPAAVEPSHWDSAPPAESARWDSAPPAEPSRWDSAPPAAAEPSRWDSAPPAAAEPSRWDSAPPAAAESAPWDQSAPSTPVPAPWEQPAPSAAAESAPWEQSAPPAAGAGWGAAPVPYQPAPGPGISPSGAVPLPPQETRVPGASLAAAPPPPADIDFAPAEHRNPTPYTPPTPRSPMDDGPGEGGAEPAWAYAPQPTSGLPAPRQPAEQQYPTSEPEQARPVDQPEAAGGSTPVSASASVPTANRIAPEEIVQPAPAAAPRVYGRPVQPEPEVEAAEPQGHQSDNNAYDRGPAGPGTAAPLPDFGNGHSPFGDRPVNGVKPHSTPSAPARDEDVPAYPQSPAPYGNDPGQVDAAHGTVDYWPAPEADRRAEQELHHGPASNTEQAYAPNGDYDADRSGYSPDRQGDQSGYSPDRQGEQRFPDDERFPDDRFPDSQGFPGDQRFPEDRFAAEQGFRGNQSFPDDQGFPESQRFPDDQGFNGQAFPNRQQSGPAGAGFGGQEPYGAPAGNGSAGTAAPWDEADPEQNRFNSFTQAAAPEQQVTQPAAEEAPADAGKGVVKPILLIVAAAAMILALAFGVLFGVGQLGRSAEKSAAFDPAVGSCVKQNGADAAAAACGEEGAKVVTAKVDAKTDCTDTSQPTVLLPGTGAGRVLCLGEPDAG